MIDLTTLRGKRLAAFDYGMARIGVAVCDEFHIVVSTRPVIVNDAATIWGAIQDRLTADRIDVLLIGVPRRHDDQKTEIIEKIEAFIEELRTRIAIPVMAVDEAFSTKRARELMLVTGMKKKRRQTKGTKDVVAAAIILQDFLKELDYLPKPPATSP